MLQYRPLYESQFGFMPGRSTTYASTGAIFILKQTIEKHREGQKTIGVTLIDLEKAYGRIPREVIYGDAQGNEMCRKSTLSYFKTSHRCQPSRIRRDSPAFSSDVPRPAK